MTANRIYRIAIVGASSLEGKELSDALSESSFAASSFTLLDEDKVTGQIASAGDEISFIQKIDAGSFEGMDLVFFAGDAEVAKKYWQSARKAGAGIIDLTSALEAESDVLVLAPWVAAVNGAVAELDLETSVVVSAHPAAVMLAFLAARLKTKFEVKGIATTVLEPASQYGRAAMDELHQQTVSLLSFQSLPRERYDAQAAFNLLAAMGEGGKIRLAESEQRIARQYEAVGGGAELGLQLIHAPVFHGYVASIFVELEKAATVEEVELALLGEHVDIVARESEPPSNLTAAGQEDVMVWVGASGASSTGESSGATTKLKLLVAVDNLKLAAVNAIACARELAVLLPLGKVQ